MTTKVRAHLVLWNPHGRMHRPHLLTQGIRHTCHRAAITAEHPHVGVDHSPHPQPPHPPPRPRRRPPPPPDQFRIECPMDHPGPELHDRARRAMPAQPVCTLQESAANPVDPPHQSRQATVMYPAMLCSRWHSSNSSNRRHGMPTRLRPGEPQQPRRIRQRTTTPSPRQWQRRVYSNPTTGRLTGLPLIHQVHVAVDPKLRRLGRHTTRTPAQQTHGWPASWRGGLRQKQSLQTAI